MSETNAEIVSNLNKRDLALVAVFVCDANSKFSIIQYDSDGNVTYAPSKVNALRLYLTLTAKGPVTKEASE